MKRSIPTTVEAAALLLDEVCPGWYARIDRPKLDMLHGKFCILGQLYDSYSLGMSSLFGSSTAGAKYRGPGKHPFISGDDYWLYEISTRHISNTKPTSSALEARKPTHYVLYTDDNTWEYISELSSVKVGRPNILVMI